jgi:hypothetical protein
MSLESEIAALNWQIENDEIEQAAKKLFDLTMCYDEMDEDKFVQIINYFYIQGGRDDPENLWEGCYG